MLIKKVLKTKSNKLKHAQSQYQKTIHRKLETYYKIKNAKPVSSLKKKPLPLKLSKLTSDESPKQRKTLATPTSKVSKLMVIDQRNREKVNMKLDTQYITTISEIPEEDTRSLSEQGEYREQGEFNSVSEAGDYTQEDVDDNFEDNNNTIITKLLQNPGDGGAVSLLLIDKINVDKELILANYPLSSEQFIALSSGVVQLIPKSVNKIYLVNNNLKDEGTCYLFDYLQKSESMRTIVVVRNGIGYHTAAKLADYLQSYASFNLRKLVLKEPFQSRI